LNLYIFAHEARLVGFIVLISNRTTPPFSSRLELQ